VVISLAVGPSKFITRSEHANSTKHCCHIQSLFVNTRSLIYRLLLKFLYFCLFLFCGSSIRSLFCVYFIYAFTRIRHPVFFILAAKIKPAANKFAAPQKAAGPIHPYPSKSTPATGFPIKSPNAPNAKLMPMCVPTRDKSGERVAGNPNQRPLHNTFE